MPYAIDIGIEAKKLEDSQRDAILAHGKNILVNAGAGSGKTFTILAKILHILDQKLAEPEEIIVVAYNNKVANDLRDRFGKLAEEFSALAEKIKKVSISKDKICPNCNEKINQSLHWCKRINKFIDRKIHTFHSYCYDLIKKNEDKQLAKFLEGDEDKVKELKSSKFFIQIIEEISSKDQSFLKKINTFFLSEIYHYKNIFKNIHSMDEYERHIKPRHVALKIIKKDDNEIPLEVKSIEELEIANFLYLNGIEFNYEEAYEGKLPTEWERWDKSRGYRPDFHIIKKDNDGKIIYDEYYEHFALDRNFNPPSYFRDIEQYIEDYKIKKSLFRGKLITTYSYQKIEGTLFEELTKQLKAKGIKFPGKNVLSESEALKSFKEAGYVNVFALLVSNFLSNFKERGADLIKLKSQFTSNWFKKLFENNSNKRARAFIELFESIYLHYQQKLKDENRVDYADMLLQGKNYIENKNIKFLIVDEFQDISPLRAEVIKEIQNKNKDVQLFVVGDDWQSIYRFSGGDIDIIVSKFKEYFGKATIKELGLTYRFNQKLCELTSSFIQKNSKQLKKNIIGMGKFNEVPVEIYRQKNHSNFRIDFSLKKKILQNLEDIFQNDKNVKTILFLSRYREFNYSNGYEDLKKYLDNIFKIKKNLFKFSTIHSAKGAEADYVFILNISDGHFGFPSTIEDDPLLKLANYDRENGLNLEKELSNAEERRVFYVALTRTKKKVFLYGEDEAHFIKEILEDGNINEKVHYNVSDIPILKDPDKVIVIYHVKGNKTKIRKNTPVKNVYIEAGNLIIQINDKKNPTKKDLDKFIKESNGEEIKVKILNINKEVLEKFIKPFNKNEGTSNKKKWDIGATYFDREVDPFVDSLINRYNVPLKSIKENAR
jgi:DNA helicase IV